MDTPRTYSPAPVAQDRRRWLAASALLAGLPGWATRATAQPAPSPLVRPIPSSGEALPVVGLGSWITFNVGNDPVARDACAEVVRAFLSEGGRLIDSSPMYGSSQPTIGHALAKLGQPAALFSAEKVWVGDVGRGAAQMEASRAFWGVPRFDLMQVHNLLAWQEHLPRLLAMKAAGRLRYVGISTSEGRRHGELERILRTQPIDFVQLTYNLLDREAEQRLLPLAQERRIAVIVNRPFRQGGLLDQLRRHPLPGWAREIDCDGWAQVALKFVVSHPAVTCAIPATSQVAHARQNMGAARGRMPDAALRARMAREVAAL
ncbi:MAG: aldo/keto reductase [Hydrogenophaga sp.]|uniref:aldo/keto reductase n=1 Tax=Hydrogenophaga sp. TaxID=1904254 RepID=UPI002ABBDCA0|nr:aldo/keto reductase [Hydrogenophaga sp.]MDZ4176994.1 aldo/keto reductase [Hydrogenophaga sp.]